MEENVSQERPKFRWITILAGVCLTFLYIFLCVFATMTGFVYADQLPHLSNDSSTPTVATVPTPKILVHPPDNKTTVKFENFSSNVRDWSLYYPNGKVETINGKLIIQSNLVGHYIIGNNQNFISTSDTYYVQADFTTDRSTYEPYGLIFGMNNHISAFYVFSISPDANAYQLYKYDVGEWKQLIPFSSTKLLRYPDANTLSVYFDKGNIELYIDGNLVASFFDKQPLQFSGVGAFVENSGYRVIVDNFFAYSK